MHRSHSQDFHDYHHPPAPPPRHSSPLRQSSSGYAGGMRERDGGGGQQAAPYAAYARQPPSPFLLPYLQLLEAEKQVLRLNDERRMRETRMADADEAILNAQFRLTKRESAIAAIEARLERIEETKGLISSGALLNPPASPNTTITTK